VSKKVTKKLQKNNKVDSKEEQHLQSKKDPIKRIQKIFENNIFLHEVSVKEIGKHAKGYDQNILKELEETLKNKVEKQKKKVKITSEEFKLIINIFKKHPTQNVLFSKNTLASLVSTLDVLFAKLFELYYRKHPEKLSLDNQSISFSDLKKITSVQEAQDFLISREIESLLFKKGLTERLVVLSSEIGVDVKPIESHIFNVRKLIKIRNLIVHNEGLIDTDYISKFKTKDKELKVGDHIKISHEYLIESLYLIYFFGTYILQEVQLHLSENIESHDFLLNNLLHTLIKNSQFEYIKPIYNFSQNHKMDEINKKLIVLNFCIGQKKQGKDVDHIKKILVLEDWTLEKPEFEMCKNALLNNHKDFYNLLEKLILSKDITKNDIEEWIIFDFYKKEPRFKKLIKTLN